MIFIVTSVLLLGSCQAYQAFQESIPNGSNVPHPCKANYMWPGVGHQNRMGGGTRNVFGMDFMELGKTWNKDICQRDSDGDGRTNGEELGDPSCTWTPGTVPDRRSNITHPGICNPFDSPECSGKNDFVDCELETLFCPRLNQSGVTYIDLRFKETKIPQTETNYMCMTFDLPEDQDYHVIATEPIIDNAEVLHHILLYSCESDGTEIPTPTACGMEAVEGSDCWIIISVWTIGSPGICFDQGIGFRFGENDFKRLKMEIHYNNPMKADHHVDKSGMRIYYEPSKEGVQDLITFVLGARSINLPPTKSKIELFSVCKNTCSNLIIAEPAKLFAGMNHMHYLGISSKIELFRAGKKVTDITNDVNYNYDSPVIHTHSPSIDLYPGDEIKMTCVYNTMKVDRYVYFGEATSDEMCYGFVFIYPKKALRWPNCVTWGIQDICDRGFYGSVITTSVGLCYWEDFISFTMHSIPRWAEEVMEKCGIDGHCRPACKEVVESVMQNPCMHDDALGMINTRLASIAVAEYTEPVLARMKICSGTNVIDIADTRLDEHDVGNQTDHNDTDIVQTNLTNTDDHSTDHNITDVSGNDHNITDVIGTDHSITDVSGTDHNNTDVYPTTIVANTTDKTMASGQNNCLLTDPCNNMPGKSASCFTIILALVTVFV